MKNIKQNTITLQKKKGIVIEYEQDSVENIPQKGQIVTCYEPTDRNEVEKSTTETIKNEHGFVCADICYTTYKGDGNEYQKDKGVNYKVVDRKTEVKVTLVLLKQGKGKAKKEITYIEN